MNSWYKVSTPILSTKESKSILLIFLYMDTLDLLLTPIMVINIDVVIVMLHTSGPQNSMIMCMQKLMLLNY
jgi:hypothetical protein